MFMLQCILLVLGSGNGAAPLTLNVSLPKVTRHFNIQSICPWHALCSAGSWIQSWSITSQRLYLAWSHFGLLWTIVTVLCTIWVILCIDPSFPTILWCWVGLWLWRVCCIGSFFHVCQFCWLDTDPVISTLWIMLDWTFLSTLHWYVMLHNNRYAHFHFLVDVTVYHIYLYHLLLLSPGFLL